MCRLLAVAESQTEAEPSQNYFMPFFFFLGFFFFLLRRCSDSALLICGRWEWLQQLQEQVLLCIVRAVVRLGTRMSPPPKGPGKMPLRVGAVNYLRVGMEGCDNGQVVSPEPLPWPPTLPSTVLERHWQ